MFTFLKVFIFLALRVLDVFDKMDELLLVKTPSSLSFSSHLISYSFFVSFALSALLIWKNPELSEKLLIILTVYLYACYLKQCYALNITHMVLKVS